MITPPAIQIELADRVQPTNAGGLGVIQQMVKQLETAHLLLPISAATVLFPLSKPVMKMLCLRDVPPVA